MSRDLVTQALTLMCANYVFPEKAAEAAALIRTRLEAGEYDDLGDEALGGRLTEQLYAVCADKHLRVRSRDAELHDAMTEEQERAVWLERSRLGNYGVARVERLDGNVGYVDVREVAYPGVAARAIAAAMELVAHSHALIIDLRRCRGGSPYGVIFWNSYLFTDDETHLNDIYDGASRTTRQFWSVSYLPGDRYLDRPVFILTSASTFSGGEEFAYNLKALNRATLIGETTGGGAHPTTAFALSPTMEVTVPVARSINPITGTNWEGTGVEPDIAVPADQARDVAYRRALQHVLDTSTASPSVRAEAQAALAASAA